MRATHEPSSGRAPTGPRGLPYQRLYINIDHVATLRQARRTDEPDPVAAATLCEEAGADGITAHLREDRRHIQDHNVERLARVVRTVFNLEMACTAEMLTIALPDDVTIAGVEGVVTIPYDQIFRSNLVPGD